VVRSLQVSVERELQVTVHADGSLTGEVIDDGRGPNAWLTCAARNPGTLTRTLAEYGIDTPQDFQNALWRDVRNARARRVAEDPEARQRAEALMQRVSRSLGLEDAA